MLAYQLNRKSHTWLELTEEAFPTMAALGFKLNTEDVPAPEYGDLPDGKYLVTIVESNEKPDKNGDGRVHLKMPIAEGNYVNQYIWDNVLIKSDDAAREPQVIRGHQTLSSIMKAVGVNGIIDTNELHDKLFYCTLKTKDGTGDNKGKQFQNKSFQPYTVGVPAGKTPSHPAVQTPNQVTKSRPSSFPQRTPVARPVESTPEARAPWRLE